jgi:hypothetical protein
VRRVIIESPFSAPTFWGRWQNKRYARRCLRDSLSRGEAPLASHLLYTQVLDDRLVEERSQGIGAGLEWLPVAEATVAYTDYGISRGMRFGIQSAQQEGIPVEYRTLPALESSAVLDRWLALIACILLTGMLGMLWIALV